MPLTRPPVYNPKLPALCSRSSRNAFDPLLYIARSYVDRILNRITSVCCVYSSITVAGNQFTRSDTPENSDEEVIILAMPSGLACES